MGYPPQGTKVNVDDLLANISVLQHHIHSRTRVYPQNVGSTVTLTADAAANTFGGWIEIVPIDTIGFEYMVIGLVIEAANRATTYLVQLGFSIVDDTDPVATQILGERRFLLPTPITKATELLHIYANHCPANAKLWGRVKTASTNVDTTGISVTIIRHQEITNAIAQLTTWPWMT